MSERIMGIYTIRNTVTGKVYVGSSSDVDARWRQHRTLLNTGAHPNAALGQDSREHGALVFAFALVEVITEVADVLPLVAAEQAWIDHYTAEGVALYNEGRPRRYALIGERRAAGSADANLVSITDAAAAFDISRLKLYRWIKAGRLRAYRSGRDERVKFVHSADVQALIGVEPIDTTAVA